MSVIVKLNIAVKKVTLLIAGLLVMSVQIKAQGDKPDIPDMIRVTVDHESEGVLVEWEASVDPTVDLYQMYSMDKGTGTPIFTFSSETLSYLHTSANLENLAYTVTAIDTLDGSGTRESLLGDNEHRAVQLELEFEPCEPANNINWSAYVGWEGLTSGYKIYGAREGEELQELKFVHPNTHSYKHRGVEYGANYSYYIETIHTSGITSLSPIKDIKTSFPEAPSVLRIDEVSVLDKANIQLRFTTDLESPVKNFSVNRRSNRDSPYTEIHTFWNANQAEMIYTDEVPTSSYSYQYVVHSVYQPEGCTNAIIVSESNPGSSIFLQSSLEARTVHLSWNPYETYTTGLSGYSIQRRNGSGEFIEVATCGPESTSWQEIIESLINGYQPGELQYRVIAQGNQVEGTDPGISYSNVVNVAVETSMQVPNAFTPGKSSNYLFKPVIDFAPEKYVMIVYDRGGRKLFESANPDEGWDGTYGGSGYAMEGVYVYFIQYTDYTGLTKILSGNVSVIYPREY